MLHWIANNTVNALLLAAIACVASRALKAHPGLIHALWLLVLVRLLLPPIAVPHWPPEPVRSWLSRSEVATVLPAKSRSVELRVKNEVVLTSTPGKRLASDGAAGRGSDANEVQLPRDRCDQLASEAPDADATVWIEREDRTESGALRIVARSTVTQSDTGPVPIERPCAPDERAPWWSYASALFLGIWGLGSLVVAWRQARLLRQLFRLTQFTSRASTDLEAKVAAAARSLTMRPPRVRTLAGISSPFVYSFRHPTILWPTDSSGRLTVPASEGLIAHELAHLKRRDHWVAWLEILGSVALWWHPLFLVARRQIRYYREVACDAWSLNALRQPPRSYASSLIDVVQSTVHSATPLPVVGATGGSKRDFERRLRAILSVDMESAAPLKLTLPFLLAILPFLPSWSESSTPRSLRGDPVDARASRLQQEPAVLRRRAQLFLDTGEWAKAETILRELIPLLEQRGDVHRDLGMTLLAQQRVEEALPEFERQIAMGFEVASGHYHVALCTLARNDKEAALRSLKRAADHGFRRLYEILDDQRLDSLRTAPQFLEIQRSISSNARYFDEAQRALEKGNPRAAIRDLTKLLYHAPKDGRAHAQLALAYLSVGNGKSALKHAREQIDLSHRVAEGWHTQALALALLQEADEGVAALSRAIDAGFGDLPRLLDDERLQKLTVSKDYSGVLGGLLLFQRENAQIERSLQEGAFADAESRARLILKRAPRVRWVQGHLWHRIGLARLSLADEKGAIEAFDREIALGGRDLRTAHYHRARALAKANQLGDALQSLAAALELGFSDVEALQREPAFDALRESGRLAEYVQRAGDRPMLEWFGAVDWQHLKERSLRRIAKGDDSGEVHHQLGWALLRLNEPREAIAAFKAQNARGFALDIARYNIACGYALVGDADEAIVWLGKALDVGWIDGPHMAADPDLKSLHGDDRFLALMKRIENASRNADRTRSEG